MAASARANGRSTGSCARSRTTSTPTGATPTGGSACAACADDDADARRLRHRRPGVGPHQAPRVSQVKDPGAEQTDVLLDPNFDPGGGAMGTMGADGSVETNWFSLLHRRVTDRAVRSPRYQWWALVALLAGLLSLNITFTVFVVALPTVKADFNTNFSVLAWASTGPLLAFGVAAPFFGKAGDLFGHRRLYQFGLLGAMVSAILTATAPNVGMLLFARALDGVQGAATGTASMAIILELFSRQDRVKALGWWSLVGAGGPVLGVTLGSPVIQFFGWRTLFWGQLVLLVIASAVVALLLPSDKRIRASRGEMVPDADGARSRRRWGRERGR